jgi:hypothetical protein
LGHSPNGNVYDAAPSITPLQIRGPPESPWSGMPVTISVPMTVLLDEMIRTCAERFLPDSVTPFSRCLPNPTAVQTVPTDGSEAPEGAVLMTGMFSIGTARCTSIRSRVGCLICWSTLYSTKGALVPSLNFMLAPAQCAAVST